ncbi:MAG: hypothetical protein IJ509_03825 [Bacilli bacterium]|nr:hypothetical protein [Bacilli bacterium]
MSKKNSKLLIIIIMIITLSLSATYAYLELSSANNTSTGQGGCFVVDYEGKGVVITDSSIASVTDENYTQSAASSITLNKNANCKIYTEAEIYLHTDASETSAPLCGDVIDINGNGIVDIAAEEKYETAACSMKYKVMQGSSVVSSGTISSPDVTGNEEQLLATVDLTETATEYTIYLWINRGTSLGYYDAKAYSGYLYAVSNQTSTITQ